MSQSQETFLSALFGIEDCAGEWARVVSRQELEASRHRRDCQRSILRILGSGIGILDRVIHHLVTLASDPRINLALSPPAPVAVEMDHASHLVALVNDEIQAVRNSCDAIHTLLFAYGDWFEESHLESSCLGALRRRIQDDYGTVVTMRCQLASLLGHILDVREAWDKYGRRRPLPHLIYYAPMSMVNYHHFLFPSRLHFSLLLTLHTAPSPYRRLVSSPHIHLPYPHPHPPLLHIIPTHHSPSVNTSHIPIPTPYPRPIPTHPHPTPPPPSRASRLAFL
ncbi:hypothetical protein BOTBODRAFT_182931 [Botryobasidium botryosum FD-172 SS1]|uniref:Uncharacterized protein n=1 Tax=Botryobasidium botryosum (strain FD-172 SS1) TaxID=930990 RepID=A0A067NCX2_BOTB1|nr:hypothetical protein BOTBODRAFT_182931 [Botryobasidium botryosum FD-172 SS1]